MPHTRTQIVPPLNGTLLIFGGVYSNLQALKRLKEIADEHQIHRTNIICTGDVVGYCAEPDESIRFVKAWGIHCIAGNVEIQLREGEVDCGCNFEEGSRCAGFSLQWYPYAYSQMSGEALEWMQALPHHIRFEYGDKQCLVVHGSYFEVAEFIFGSTPWEHKQRNFDAAKVDVILAGHSGLPFHHIQDGKMWLNAGVIGMPANDGTRRVWYMLMNEGDSQQSLQFEHKAFEYNHTLAFQKMQEAQLPCEYANTLLSGLWDNCEILPPFETQQQGIHIAFDQRLSP